MQVDMSDALPSPPTQVDKKVSRARFLQCNKQRQYRIHQAISKLSPQHHWRPVLLYAVHPCSPALVLLPPFPTDPHWQETGAIPPVPPTSCTATTHERWHHCRAKLPILASPQPCLVEDEAGTPPPPTSSCLPLHQQHAIHAFLDLGEDAHESTHCFKRYHGMKLEDTVLRGGHYWSKGNCADTSHLGQLSIDLNSVVFCSTMWNQQTSNSAPPPPPVSTSKATNLTTPQMVQV